MRHTLWFPKEKKDYRGGSTQKPALKDTSMYFVMSNQVKYKKPLEVEILQRDAIFVEKVSKR